MGFDGGYVDEVNYNIGSLTMNYTGEWLGTLPYPISWHDMYRHCNDADEEGFDNLDNGGRWWPVKDTEEERDLTMLGE